MERREFLQFVAAIPVAGLAFKAGAEETEVEIYDPIDITPDEIDRRWVKEGANDYFDRLIREGRKNELGMAFYLLAGRIIDIAKFKTIDRDDAIQECVFVCFEKLPQYQEASKQFLIGSQPKRYGKKPKAFNYFTTIMLCRIRQTYRSQRNHKELREKYEEYLS
jgi:hypothetical protein